MKEFIKTEKINLLESEIERLERELIDQKNLFKNELQKEFDKQFGLVQEKTILLHDGKEYVYKRLFHEYFPSFWIEVICLKKNGAISKNTKTLYGYWRKTEKEYVYEN